MNECKGCDACTCFEQAYIEDIPYEKRYRTMHGKRWVMLDEANKEIRSLEKTAVSLEKQNKLLNSLRPDGLELQNKQLRQRIAKLEKINKQLSEELNERSNALKTALNLSNQIK